MISCPSWVSAHGDGTPPACALALGLGSWDRIVGWTRQKTLWVGGRIGASPAEEQGTPPLPLWEGDAMYPRPRMQSPDLLGSEGERPFGALLYNPEVCVCPL